MSISFLLFGISTSRSLETGEKQVSTLFSVARNPLIVVRPLIVPVITAVFRPYLSLIYLLTWSYRYSAVSENAENMSTFLLSGLMGFVILSSNRRSSFCSFVSCSGVMSATIKVSSSKTSASCCNSLRQLFQSMSASSIFTFLPTVKNSVFSSSISQSSLLASYIEMSAEPYFSKRLMASIVLLISSLIRVSVSWKELTELSRRFKRLMLMRR